MRLNKYIGDKAFYRMVLAIVLPIIIQNAITSFVNLLDNIMVGQIGTMPMSAVSITNQLMQVVNLGIIGSVNAAGIFGAQYYGKKDYKGVVDCVHIKLGVTVFFLVLGITVFLLGGRNLLGLYMDEAANTPAQIAETLGYAETYLRISLIGLIPFAFNVAIGTISREAGKTKINMYASIVGVLTNFVLNYLLIFGHFGFPKLGVAGAAVATVIARFVEVGLTIFGLYRIREELPFLPQIFKGIHVERSLLKTVLVKGLPLTLNEILWSGALAAISQCYSTRGLDAIAAINITLTVSQLFSIMCMAMGHAIAIIVGQRLGAGRIEEAKDVDTKMMATSILLNIVTGGLLILAAPLIPRMYNTSAYVQNLAVALLRVAGAWLPMQAIYMGCYFTLRSGGKTMITFLFDSAYSVCISLPVAFLLTRFTGLDIFWVYLFVTFADLPKAILGLVLLKKGIWANNLVG